MTSPTGDLSYLHELEPLTPGPKRPAAIPLMPRKPRTPEGRARENELQNLRYKTDPRIQKQHRDKAARRRVTHPYRQDSRTDGLPKIYFIRAGQAVKIGFTTKKPWARMNELQVGNPEEMTMLFFLPGTQEQELALHARFAHLRIRGEWFRPASELLDFIESLKS